MRAFGIFDNDLLVVDRALNAAEGSIVIAVIDGEMTVKQVRRIPEGVLLCAGNPDYPDILVGPERELQVWGVVRHAIHSLRHPCGIPSH
jgi:DNA polymerase V